ncbi:MAG: ThiF family adenylyltransferase [Bacilli bacterium]
MADDIYSRTIQLIGEDAIIKLKKTTVLIVGIGGVGGTCFETLVRSGVGTIIIIDKDCVDVTNLNRQLLFTENDIGKSKVDVALKRAHDINLDVKVISLKMNIDDTNIDQLNDYKIDYIVDAIDSIYSKASLIRYAKGKNIPIIVSLGMAKRLDPSSLLITSLNKSTGDPLAKKLRYVLKHNGIEFSDVKCVLSKEQPLDSSRIPASMMMVPSAAGLLLASFIIKQICL